MADHARSPYHRIDVFDTSRHIRVLVNDRVIAESTRARVLLESGLPTRWYLPLEDVDRSLLEDSPTRTTCACKGHARYLMIRMGDTVEPDLGWIYTVRAGRPRVHHRWLPVYQSLSAKCERRYALFD